MREILENVVVWIIVFAAFLGTTCIGLALIQVSLGVEFNFLLALGITVFECIYAAIRQIEVGTE